MTTRFNLNERPANGDLAFHWIYWELLDKGEAQLADAVAGLLESRESLISNLEWHHKRRIELSDPQLARTLPWDKAEHADR